MLKQLHISNYALIDELEVNFQPGFNVITGETGAGKSILLGALSFALGERADTNVLYDKEKKCVVEAHFKLTDETLKPLFEDNDLDFETEWRAQPTKEKPCLHQRHARGLADHERDRRSAG